MVARREEMEFLNSQMLSEDNAFAVMYGRVGIGKTTVINEFINDKKVFYYCCKECSEKEQIYLLKEEWEKSYGIVSDGNNLLDIFRQITGSNEAKSIIVIEEINLFLKQGNEILEVLKQFWEENKTKNNLFILVTTSSVQWVENSMIDVLGEFAMEITGLHKLAPFGFLEIVNRFPTLNSKEAVNVYGVLGGIPGYMDMWQENKSLRSNIIDLFLDKNAPMYREPERFLKTELRELAFYNTILYNLAAGRNKLNELHDRTGYSRAKISVYIKNLIELDIVEKVFSFDTDNRDNVKKGIYDIKDPVIHFWYKFVFPNMSELERGNKEYVYDKIIKPEFDEYIHRYFVKMSKEFLILLSKYNRLPMDIEICESWFGKNSTIDILAKDEKTGKVLAGKCKWGSKKMSETDLRKFINSLDEAGIDPDYYYMFSQGEFTKELQETASSGAKLNLISLEDM